MTKRLLMCFLFLPLLLTLSSNSSAEEVVYQYGFELGQNGWEIDNGIWELCVYGATAPPDGGFLYFSTVCDANYPTVPDSRLISPEIQLPAPGTLAPDEELHLRFWHWFSYSGGDYGYVQISVYDESTGWSAWETLGSGFGWAESNVWSPALVDLTEYAGKKVKLAFFHTTNNDSSASYGWSVDNVKVIKGVPAWDGDFECDWGDWSAGNGVWKVGTPVGGTKVCYSGTQCAGTILGSTTYPRYTDSRLVSPTFEVPAAGAAELSFRHWYSYGAGDYGKVQISVYDALTGWSSWQDLTAVNITGVSAG
ncbi:MAG: hypothetical protein EHM37_23030, partial [Deltaproteobacteria bacterium]